MHESRRLPFPLTRLPRLDLLPVPLLLLAVVASVARAAVPPTLAPEDIPPGAHAIVRSVFEGDSIEEFQADIVGVLSGGRAEGRTIVARATSERLKQLGVAQGMSGSPVYVDGKLIGALSSSWPFEREPLFGITPIREMLPLLEHPTESGNASAGPSGVELGGGSSDGLRFAQFHWDPDGPDVVDAPGRAVAADPDEGDEGGDPGEEEPEAARSRGFSGTPVALPVPLSCAGFTPAGLAAAGRALAPLGFRAVPGGAAADGGPDAAGLAPGSAVAVDLMRGDLQISAIGTVTWRDGDRVLLFGHPFFQAGGVRLPLSTARITTVVGSEYISFKLGARGREIGTVTQDRRTGVSGRIGPRAPLLPLAIRVEHPGRGPQAFRFELVEDRTLAPQLAGIAALNSVLESGGTGSNQTLEWTLSLHRHGRAPLTLADATGGEAPTSEMAAAITSPLAFLFGNPYERLELDSVRVSVRVRPGRSLWTLRSARLLDAAVRPGGRARLECRIEPWRGAVRTVRLDLPGPEELPGGRYVLWVGGGPELSRFEAARFPARFRPVSLDDAWARLARLRSANGLYAIIAAAAPDVTASGRDYPELPGSAAAVLSSGLATGDLARRSEAALLGETRLPLEGVTRGELQLPLAVDPKAP